MLPPVSATHAPVRSPQPVSASSGRRQHHLPRGYAPAESRPVGSATARPKSERVRNVGRIRRLDERIDRKVMTRAGKRPSRKEADGVRGSCRDHSGGIAVLRMACRRSVMQPRALTHADRREPSSYLLDPKVNFVPELPLGAALAGAGTRLVSRVNMPAPVGGLSS
jgi:hypothetical protein